MGALQDEQLGQDLEFSSLQSVFDLESRVSSEAATRYREYIYRTIREEVDGGTKFGALILEPVLLGAGGMLFWYICFPFLPYPSPIIELLC